MKNEVVNIYFYDWNYLNILKDTEINIIMMMKPFLIKERFIGLTIVED